MASRAERRRAAALLSFRGPPPQLGTRPLCGGRARKLRGSEVVGSESCPEASVRALRGRRVGRLRANASAQLNMVFEELPLVATETTVPRGRVSSAGKLGCSCALCRCPASRTSARWRPQSWGAREVVKKAITKSLARTQLTAAKKKKVPPPELCWTIAEAVAWSESLARAVTCDLSWARGRARLESLELYLVVY